MRTMLIGAALTLLAASALPAHAAEPKRSHADPAAEAAPPGPPPAPPRVFQAAGYSQPDITPGLCKSVGPSEARCEIPEMTAGRYVIIASGTSTATGEGAVQALAIVLDGGGEEQLCNKAQTAATPPKGGKPWTEGPRTLTIACTAQIISDDKMVVRALYSNAHATLDEKGPGLAFRKVPWSPVWSVAPVPLAAKPAPQAGK